MSADLRSEHNFNPRSPHGERQCSLPQPLGAFQISIHAPRTGSDLETTSDWCQIEVFQSTLPARGATRFSPFARARRSYFNPRSPHGERRALRLRMQPDGHFNPRSPHGERPNAPKFGKHRQLISIHAPRTGSDTIPLFSAFVQRHFNPRSPHGERPVIFAGTWRLRISIHAPRTGSDDPTKKGKKGNNNFNPRSPHGERHIGLQPRQRIAVISIHAPRTGSDPMDGIQLSLFGISIHAPRTGSDGNRLSDGHACEFQSTLPARGATLRINPAFNWS